MLGRFPKAFILAQKKTEKQHAVYLVNTYHFCLSLGIALIVIHSIFGILAR